MFILNVTTKVDWSVADKWQQWMLDIHIPEIIGTGCFEKHQFVKLLDVDDVEGPTYAVQYFAAQKAKYDEYVRQYSQHFRERATEKWGDRFISFKSLMEVIN